VIVSPYLLWGSSSLPSGWYRELLPWSQSGRDVELTIHSHAYSRSHTSIRPYAFMNYFLSLHRHTRYYCVLFQHICTGVQIP